MDHVLAVEGGRDLDLVEFEDLPTGTHAGVDFGLLENLKAMCQRPVDLVMASAIRDSFLRDAIERSRMPLYTAGKVSGTFTTSTPLPTGDTFTCPTGSRANAAGQKC